MGRLSSHYRELPPPPHLAASVACLWVREVEHAGTQLVLPDGCIDLVASGGEIRVAGPDTGPVLAPLRAGDTVVGLRFRPGAAPAVLGWPASELRDRRLSLEDLWGRRGALEPSLPALIAAVARRDAPPPDPIVQAAVGELARGRRVGDLPAHLHLSERQLRRRFHAAIGYGPKALARVLRLHRMLALAPTAGDNLARLAAEAGYADHAHMASETARLTGLPPRTLLDGRFAQAGLELAA
ncbi:MAG TPA: helix-turn-helix domain-containing protein [Solirubrobacteraceae bacterium]|nr:helix-turn-helix domain-containing protein [Solirubrobacteraceae bacterium]